MRIATALLLFLTLTVSRDAEGFMTFVITSDAPRHFYVELDSTNGVSVGSPVIYEFDLEAGSSFGRRVIVTGGPSAGTARVRVWASDGEYAEHVLPIEKGFALPLYIPLAMQ